MQWYADLNLVHGVAPPVSDVKSLGRVAFVMKDGKVYRKRS